ncbi:hypothetical protein MMC34_008051 [Xylographa carneopallida]|nr:hypothetical protein [Xylographa carneopallida]
MEYLWHIWFCWLVTQLQISAAVPLNQNRLEDSIKSADSVKIAKAKIIPDVLDDFIPTFSLSLSYTSAHKTVSLGNNIHPSDTHVRPVFEMHRLPSATTLLPTRTLASNRTYTIVPTDPDATSRADPINGQYCHWIVTGITISATSSSHGTDEANAYTPVTSPHSVYAVATELYHLIEYMPPAPPKGTGKHRYVFVLLASKDDDNGRKDLNRPKDRPHWGYGAMGKGVREWAFENDLVPLAANFFYAKAGK